VDLSIVPAATYLVGVDLNPVQASNRFSE